MNNIREHQLQTYEQWENVHISSKTFPRDTTKHTIQFRTAIRIKWLVTE